MFVIDPFHKSEFNWDDFYSSVRIAVRALDKIIDENLDNHALEEQRIKSFEYRNIGCGIMGLADALIMMGYKYGSSEAVDFCRELMRVMFIAALEESISLAEVYGPFPKYDKSIWDSSIIKNAEIPTEIFERGKMHGLRNCSLLSIAPTGSLATLFGGIGGGCEPYFAFEYNRTTKSLNGDKDRVYKQYAPIVRLYHDIFGKDSTLPPYFVSSENIHWKQRVDMQAALQVYCDTAISSTVNLPESTPKEDVEQLYLYAWKKGLKGITVFRSGCSRIAILSTKEATSIQLEPPSHFNTITPTSRKSIGITYGSTFCKKCACGTLYITVNRDKEGNIVEVFTHTSKGGICQANTNGLTRMASMALRCGVKVDEVVDQLKGIKCPACLTLKAKGEGIDGISCPDILSKTIEEFSKLDYCIPDEECATKPIKVSKIEPVKGDGVTTCPECGSILEHSSGCLSCQSCGYSRCS